MSKRFDLRRHHDSRAEGAGEATTCPDWKTAPALKHALGHVGVSVPVIMQFVAGVVTRARDFDHDVLLLTQDDVSGLDRVTGGSMVDALVMMDIEADDPRS